MRPLLVLLLLWPASLAAQPSAGPAAPPGLCRAAILAAERASGVPDRLMQAVGIIESGRRDAQGQVAPWPWTINVEGQGFTFESKAEAIAAVNAHRARGARSIDVGCMQVNLLHHGQAFASLDEAFDPAANARYAARFLLQLLAQTGSWPRAVAGYHSLTPDLGEPYARKVLAQWALPDRAAPKPEPLQASAAGSLAPFAPGSTLGSSTLAPASLPSPRATILPAAASAGAAPGTARGLDAYRATPVRLVASPLLRRS